MAARYAIAAVGQAILAVLAAARFSRRGTDEELDAVLRQSARDRSS